MFSWIAPRIMDRLPGHDSTVVLLADRSTSMPFEAISATDALLQAFCRAFPGLRVFGFHFGIAETRVRKGDETLSFTMPDDGHSKRGKHYVNRTMLGSALQRIAGLQPAKTIVLSDGGAADKSLALAVPDQMTGDVDCYWTPSIWSDRAFMEELARRGRGRFVRFDADKTDMRREMQQSFATPPVSRVTVVHQPPVIQQGQAYQQAVAIPQARITVRPGATVRLQAQHAHARPLQVEAQPPQAHPLQIADKREIPVEPIPTKKRSWLWL